MIFGPRERFVGLWCAAALIASALACPPPGNRCAIADWNGDGAIDCGDYAAFAADLSARAACADLNQDGVFDAADSTLYLAAYHAPGTCRRAANDECTGAVVLTGATASITFDLCAASTGSSGQGPGCGDTTGGPRVRQDLWYGWQATCNGVLTIATASAADTRAVVYTSAGAFGTGPCPVSATSAIACDPDDSGNVLMSFPVTAGTRYLIQLGLSPRAATPQAATGSLNLSFDSNCNIDINNDCAIDCEDAAAFYRAWLAGDAAADVNNDGFVDGTDSSDFFTRYLNPTAPCTAFQSSRRNSNDDCLRAKVLTLTLASPSVSEMYDTRCATTDGPLHPRCVFSPTDGKIDKDIWYRVTAPADGILWIHQDVLTFPLGDLRVALYAGRNCGSALSVNLIACNDDSMTGVGGEVRAIVRSGIDYLIRIGGDNNSTGAGIVSISFAPQTSVCPPQAATANRSYRITGTGNGTTRFAWTIQGPQFAIGSLDESPLTGVSPSLRDQFVAKINAAAAAAGCGASNNSIRAVAGRSPIMFRIFTSGGNAPELWVGPAFRNPTCFVSAIVGVNGSGSCTIGPQIEEVPSTRSDCNHNGIDDLEDVFNGTSSDDNADGIPDECGCAPCIADFNQDGGVDGSDVASYFEDWMNGRTCADANYDGGVDGPDISAFFDVWALGGC